MSVCAGWPCVCAGCAGARAWRACVRAPGVCVCVCVPSVHYCAVDMFDCIVIYTISLRKL